MRKPNDKRWRMMKCNKCGKEQERYSTAKKCCAVGCGGKLVEKEDKKEGRCPTCGKPWNACVPRRICSLCGEQITRSHKWMIGDDGRIRHRNCKDPKSYGDRK
jgi:hypothetical protein